jgi:hypothetical protein
MSFLDDIKARIEIEKANAQTSINEFINEKKADATVRIIDSISGRLAGVRSDAQSQLQAVEDKGQSILPGPVAAAGLSVTAILLIAGAAWFLISKKGK